jgi:outer membrane lipoprotein SlyB
MLTSACQTTETASSDAPGRWVIDSVAQKCVASVVGGAIIGGVVGAMVGGSRGAAGGAAIGGVAGVGACAVIMALNAQDRARIKEAQLRAAQTNEQQVLEYQGEDGLRRSILVRPERAVVVARPESGPPRIVGEATDAEDAAALAPDRQICTVVFTSASVETKGATDVPAQTICRDADGKLAPTLVAAG